VYEGQHLDIGKRVAIKLLEAEHSKAEEIAARFRREGRAASRVESDHVVQVFDVGQDDTHGLYMVMEFLEGEDLARRLEREKVLDVALAIDIAWQAARGLAKAHAAGVIHRDLKPGNVFLSQKDDGSTAVKIVDFGISKLNLEEETLKGTITRHGSAVGTPQYMSPEQAQGFPIDLRTDVWALGCVLYEMLAGKQAYELLENYEQTIFAIVLRKPPALAEIAPWVPQPIAAIVAKAMEHDLELRIPDCGTFARLLAETSKSLDLNTRAANAPLSLMRRATGSNPRVDLEELGARVIVVGGGHKASSGAATAPAFEVPDSVPRLPAAAQPPTVTGVAVKTGHHRSIEAEPLSVPPKKGSGGAVVAVLLLGALSAAAAFVMVKGSPFAKQEQPAASPPPVVSSPAPVIAPPEPSPSVSVEAPVPSVSAKPSSSASAKPEKPGTKPGSKPSTHPIASASAAPSASAAKPATDGDQFGGTGVSNSY
jgi:eukaryotic-like serine/threonine-protein kinase